MTCSWFSGLLLGVLALGATAEAKLRVVATVSDLGALAREVGGDQVEVKVLAKSTQDPHTVDAKPSLVLDLARADLLLANGMELETGWLPALLANARNTRIQKGQPGYLEGSTLVQAREVPVQKLDRSMGDIHPGGNPHYTKDPRNARLLARGISARLVALSPEHEQKFQSNLQEFEKKLDARLSEWDKKLAPYKGTPVVTYHKSWIYFVEWAGLTEVAFVEPKPGVPPSTGHVAKVMNVIRDRKVPLILQEQWYSAATSELLANKTGAKLVRVSGMTDEGKSYLEHMDVVVSAIAAALSSSAPALR